MTAHRAGRARYRLALLVLTAIVLLTLDLRGFGPLESAQRTVRDALGPVRDGAAWVVSPVVSFVRGVVDYRSLESENDRLRAEIEELRGQILTGETDTETLRRLLAELDLFDVRGVDTVMARVRVGSVGNFDESFVEIDKGASAGLRSDMVVVTSAGLVGRLVRVDDSRSLVELVTSPRFRVGVRIGPDVALAEGTGPDAPLRAAGGLGGELQVGVGDPVTTAGGASSLFPPDVPVGRIIAVEEVGGSPEVLIEPLADLGNLDFVTVLLFEAEG